MSLANLRRRSEAFENKQQEENARYEPTVDDTPEPERYCDLGCIVYFDPEHEVARDLEALEVRIRADLPPRYYDIRFFRLTSDDIKSWSPFETRLAEDAYLQIGFAKGAGLWHLPPAPPPLRGRPQHHLARETSLQAQHQLTLIAKATVVAARASRPSPVWLKAEVETILAPVCGRESVRAGQAEGGRRRDIPITQQGGLLVGCTNFSGEPRDIYPSYHNTPNSALKNAADFLRLQDRYSPSFLVQQVAFELQNCDERTGGKFKPAAAALWLLQNVMMMRLSIEEVRRSYIRRPLPMDEEQTQVIGADATFIDLVRAMNDTQTHEIEDNELQNSIFLHYGEQPWFEEPAVISRALDLNRRMLTVFHGGVVVPIDNEDDARRYGHIQAIAEWIGRLRWAREANLTRYVASSIMSVLDWDPDGEEMWFDTRESGGSSSLLEAMLPEAGWQALIEAAHHVADTLNPVPFTVSYALVSPEQPRPSGVVDIRARQVTLIGPLLMLPLKDAEHWAELVRSVPDAGLYATPAG